MAYHMQVSAFVTKFDKPMEVFYQFETFKTCFMDLLKGCVKFLVKACGVVKLQLFEVKEFDVCGFLVLSNSVTFVPYQCHYTNETQCHMVPCTYSFNMSILLKFQRQVHSISVNVTEFNLVWLWVK